MANQNLSQFGEKLFVADADHTFIWDTAASISKRVSRNSWLSAGSIATSTPLTISQTWTDAAVAFAVMKIVATDTNSAAGSDFLELYSGTSTQPLRMDINKTGQINIYGTWTDASNYERLSFSAPTAGNAIIGTNRSGGTARGLEFQTDGVTRIGIAATGIINMSAAIFDSSIRTNYINNYGNILSMFSFVNDSTGTTTYANGGSAPLMGFGGTNNTFPAIARDGAGIKFTGAAAGLTSWIKVPPVAVGSLPLANTAGAGARAFVNDALAPTFGSAVTGGGAVLVPVYSDGSAWHVG